MAIFNIDSSFTPESLDSFVSFVNALPKDENITIYLRSTGGYSWSMYVMLDIINSNPERFEIVASGEISSAAFQLFFTATCSRRIFNGTWGVYHQARIAVDINERATLHSNYDKAMGVYMRNYSKKESEFLMQYLEFTKEERRKVNRGEDLYLQYDRLNQMLETSVLKNGK